MSELKYKVGDKVRIKSIEWYNENNVNGDDILENIGIFSFFPYMAKFCGQVLTIKDVRITYYTMEETDYYTCWTDEMIEGLVEEETKPIHFIDIAIKPHNVRGDEIIKMLEEMGGINAFSFDGSDHNCVNPFAYYINDDKQIYGGGIGFLRRNGYKIHTLEELMKKEATYPKTCEECQDYIESCYDEPFCADLVATGYKSKLIESFARLLICRDAYWRIAGDEMGLGKPWEPDWDAKDNHFYTIHTFNGKIECSATAHRNAVLIFPTEEVRDEFYENFKEEIEICKELL